MTSYLTGSYQASFVLSLSLITSKIGGQSKKMIVSGMIWMGACIGNIGKPLLSFCRSWSSAGMLTVSRTVLLQSRSSPLVQARHRLAPRVQLP